MALYTIAGGGGFIGSNIAEQLLRISGEDSVTIDRKYRPAWTGRLPCRFLILTNGLPQISDTSGALASRFVVLKLTKSFLGREDLGLIDRLLTELPSILNWAIEGWQRLQQRGHFIQPASAEDAIQELHDLASPVGAFVRECCEVGPGLDVKIQALFGRWEDWCDDNGRNHHGKKGTQQSCDSCFHHHLSNNY